MAGSGSKRPVRRVTSGQALTARTLVTAITVSDTAGAATVNIRDGGAGGTIQYTFVLGGIGSIHAYFGEGGVEFKTDVYVDIAAGAGTSVTITVQ